MPSLELQVELKERSYPVYIGRDLGNCIANKIPQKNCALITCEKLEATLKDFIQKTFPNTPKLVLPSGETTKSIAFFEQCHHFLANLKLDRKSTLIALGGGVIGDLTGFVAATYLRGIQYYNIPTTLLAMVDSSIGGKTGLNLPQGKNLIGLFYQPKGVFIDTHFLKTLPQREFNSAMAEVIKYGLLAEESLLARLEKPLLTPHSNHLESIIEHCCRIKASIVCQDEFESNTQNKRALLNLGHTFGHAIEATAGYGNYLHGEAIAVGLHLAGRLSESLGTLSSQDVIRIDTLLKHYDLPIKLHTPLDINQLMQAMQYDKKSQSGEPSFITLQSIGQGKVHGPVDSNLIKKLWLEVGARIS